MANGSRLPRDGEGSTIGSGRLRDAILVDAERPVAADACGDVGLKVQTRHGDGLGVGLIGIAGQGNLGGRHLDSWTARYPQDILYTSQGIQLSMAEVRGMVARGIFIVDGRFHHDLFHV